MKQSAIVLGLVLLVMPVVAQKSRPAEMLLESARQKETVEGDLKGALRMYEDVVKRHAGDRAAVAKALVGMAECHQKLGDSEALRLYQRVAREFVDQKDAAQVARARMAQLRPRGAGPAMVTNRKVFTTPPGGDLYGTVSADGRYVPYVNWEKKGNLFLRDLETGQDRQITDAATDAVGTPHREEQFAEEYAISRDGKQIVYSWFRGDTDRYELRIASLQGTGVPAFRKLFDDKDVEWIGPHDWSADGKWIAVVLFRMDKTAQMGLVSAESGNLRVLRTVDWRGTNGMFFSPDGRYLAFDLHSGEASLERDIYVLDLMENREQAVVAHPSNDTLAGWTPDGKRLLFASDRRGSMDLWGIAFSGGTPELLQRDFATPAQMGVSSSGALYYVYSPQFGADIQVASFDFERGVVVKAPAQAVHTYVGKNRAPLWSPDGKQMAWQSQRGGSGSRYAVIGVKDLASGQVREILPMPGFDRFFSFLWERDGRHFLVTGKDLKARTGIFRIDVETGKSTLVMEHRQFGLSVQESPDGKYLYYAVRNPPGEHTVVFLRREVANGTEKVLFEGKKWNTGGLLSPDGRYIIAMEFIDRRPMAVQAIATDGSGSRELIRVKDPQRAGLLAFTPDGQAALVRKVLGPGSVEVWRYPLDGGAPRKLEGGAETPGTYFQVHPDGRQVVFPVNLPSSPFEIWVLENFLPGDRSLTVAAQ